MSHYLTTRNDTYYYMRRVPDDVSHLDKRGFVRKTLKTKDEIEATKKALIFNDFVESYWNSLLLDNNIDPVSAFELTVKRAKVHDLTYKSAAEISADPIVEVVDRLSKANKLIDSPDDVSSILGGEERPPLHLSELWDDYFDFTKPNLAGKSEEQLRKWKHPRIRAWRNFRTVNGEISAYEINRNHILNFRAWWSDRLQGEGLAANSANKDFTHLKSILAYGQDNKQGIPYSVSSLFERVRFEEGESERQPFEKDFILNHLLKNENLLTLNPECRYFLFAMADTGARPSELVGLNASNGDIRLDTDIPYISIRPDKGRELKTRYSKREIPLVGASIYAFQHLKNGFERYYQKPDSLSATLNKYLRDNNLLPTVNHTVYSLRHSFEDRLTEVEPPEKVQAVLMGHKYSRERYGNGPKLEQKHKWLKKIAFSIT